MRKEIVENSRILLVDNSPQDILLLWRMLNEGGYKHLRCVNEPHQALAEFAGFAPDLVAIDPGTPHVEGFELLRQLQSIAPAGASVPVLVVTADHWQKSKQQALSLGAKDFLTKPLDKVEALLRIYNLLETRWLYSELQTHSETLERRVRDRTIQLEEAQLEILQRLALAAEYRDDCTGQHTKRVGAMASRLARTIGLPEQQVELIRLAAPLHDIGKIGIPDGILLKPGKLTPDEYAHAKTHTGIGRNILSGSKFPILQTAERIALFHHERWDGAGYYRIPGPAIPIEARIVSVVDAFDVITHSRPYKEAASVDVAVDLIRQERGGQFDPTLVDAFCNLLSHPDISRLGSALENQQPALPKLEASRLS